MKDAPTWFWVAAIIVAFLMAVVIMKPFNFGKTPIGGAISQFQATAIPTSQYFMCSDGTLANQCSRVKPKVCLRSGGLVNDCIKCGCSTGQICATGGSCISPSPHQMRTYIEDDLDYQHDSIRYTAGASRFGSTTSSFSPTAGPKMITAENTQVFSLPNNGVIYSSGGISVQEKQNAYLFAYTSYDETAKAIQAKYAKTGYEVAFVDVLPLCLDASVPIASCPSNKMLKNSNIKLWLLGSSWYVRDYSYTNESNASIYYLKLVREDGKTMFLTQGQEIQIAGQAQAAKFWKVDIASSAYYGAYELMSLGLKRIQIYNDLDQTYKTPITQTLNSGEGINIIKYPVGFEFSNNGVESQNYDLLSLAVYKGFSLNLAPNGTNSTSTVTGDILAVVSGRSNAFQFGSRSVPDIYVALKAVRTDCTYAGIGGGCVSYPVQKSIYYLGADGFYYDGGQETVSYYYSSGEASVLTFETPSGGIPADRVIISIPELTEDNSGAIAYKAVNWHYNLLYDTALRQLVNSMGLAAVDKIGYSLGGNPDAFATKEAGYLSYRGTEFTGISPTSATFKYPATIRHALYSFTALGDDIVWTGSASNIIR